MARGSKGFKMPGNIQQVMQQAQRLQADIQKAQEKARLIEMEAASGGGMVKACCNGEYQLVSLEISPEVVVPEEIEMLQDLIIAAVNEATKKVKLKTAELMEDAAGGMPLPKF
ncbi:MAG: YbaB/EbfC family nucleoid-associated protein [Bdellovibrionales bacterium]|nr:YbaB/EbfC family nucleoid-associated protein [Bdellovibrionales bacterium]